MGGQAPADRGRMEFADRGGLSGKLYAWGNDFKPGEKFMANTYQGQFPVKVSH